MSGACEAVVTRTRGLERAQISDWAVGSAGLLMAGPSEGARMIKTSELIWQETQHQMLFHLIDQIKSEEFDRHVLVQLHMYAVHHFSLEEAYMVELDYPYAESHIQAHNQFRRELEQMTRLPEMSDHRLRESLSLFLEEWLKRHVLGIDKKFEEFVLESEYK